MQINQFSEAIIGRRRNLNHFTLFRIANSIALHKHPKLNEPITKQTNNNLHDGDQSSDDHADLRVLFYAEIVEPYYEPDQVRQKKRSYIQMQQKRPKPVRLYRFYFFVYVFGAGFLANRIIILAHFELKISKTHSERKNKMNFNSDK